MKNNSDESLWWAMATIRAIALAAAKRKPGKGSYRGIAIGVQDPALQFRGLQLETHQCRRLARPPHLALKMLYLRTLNLIGVGEFASNGTKQALIL